MPACIKAAAACGCSPSGALSLGGSAAGGGVVEPSFSVLSPSRRINFSAHSLFQCACLTTQTCAPPVGSIRSIYIDQFCRPATGCVARAGSGDALAQAPEGSLWRAVELSECDYAVACTSTAGRGLSTVACQTSGSPGVWTVTVCLCFQVTLFSGSTLLVNSTAGRRLRSAHVPALPSGPALQSTCGGLHRLTRYVQRILIR